MSLKPVASMCAAKNCLKSFLTCLRLKKSVSISSSVKERSDCLKLLHRYTLIVPNPVAQCPRKIAGRMKHRQYRDGIGADLVDEQVWQA